MKPQSTLSLLILTALVLASFLGGCSRTPPKSTAATPVDQKSGYAPSAGHEQPQEQIDHEPMAPQPSVGEAAEVSAVKPAEMPKVVMAEVDRSKCKLFVGDTLPLRDLSDIQGKTSNLQQWLGSTATILAFFKASDTMRERLLAVNLLADLQDEIARPYGPQGIAVVAIHVGGPSENLKQVLQEANTQFPVLIDADGSYLGELTAHSPPVLYLIDRSGRILWLDIEYSRATRENLITAVKAVLATAP